MSNFTACCGIPVKQGFCIAKTKEGLFRTIMDNSGCVNFTEPQNTFGAWALANQTAPDPDALSNENFVRPADKATVPGQGQRMVDQNGMANMIRRESQAFDLGGKVNWKMARQHCIDKGFAGLCNSDDYCPRGGGNPTVPHVTALGRTGEQWAPINNFVNAWINVGPTSRDRCRSWFSTQPVRKPSWRNDEDLPLRGAVMCCRTQINRPSRCHRLYTEGVHLV